MDNQSHHLGIPLGENLRFYELPCGKKPTHCILMETPTGKLILYSMGEIIPLRTDMCKYTLLLTPIGKLSIAGRLNLVWTPMDKLTPFIDSHGQTYPFYGLSGANFILYGLPWANLLFY